MKCSSQMLRVCVMYILSLTGLTNLKDCGVWRKLWLCRVDTGVV